MKTFLHFYLILQVLTFHKTYDLLLPSKNTIPNIFKNIFSQFVDFNIIVHVDSVTLKNLYLLPPEVVQAKLILNYPFINFTNKPFRPTGYKFLNVVFLTNLFDFQQFSRTIFNLESNDVIVMVSQEDVTKQINAINVQIVNFWHQEGLHRSGTVFVFSLLTNAFYHQCFYCGNLTGVLRKVSNIKSLRNYFNDFTNFNGHEFKIGYMPYLPFFWLKRLDESVVIEVGSEANLLKLLSGTLNFRYRLQNFEGHVGGEWRAMVEAVHFGVIDWAIGGISLSPDRAQMVDFTANIHTEAYSIVYACCSSGKVGQFWRQVLQPFQISLWIFLLFILFLVAYLLNRISKLLNDDSSKCYASYFMTTLQAMLEQPQIKSKSRTITKRVLLTGWWCAAIIIVTAYKSKLASTLIYPHFLLPTTIEELLANRYHFQVNNNDWSVLKENLEESLDPTYKEVLKRSKDNLNICDAIDQVAENRVAVIDEENSLQFEVIRNCRSRMNSNDFIRLRVLEQQVFPSFHIWPLQLAAPYRHKFSNMIINLHSSGILEMWYNLQSKDKLASTNRLYDVHSTQSYSTSTMRAPLLILSVGLILATIIFTIELIYFTMSTIVKFYRQRHHRSS